MKNETLVYFKVESKSNPFGLRPARNQAPKREHLSKRQALDNKAFSGRVNRDKKAHRELDKLF